MEHENQAPVVKQDLLDLEARLLAHSSDLEARLRTHISDVETRLLTHAEQMETRLSTMVGKRVEEVETKLLTTFHGWARSMEVRTRISGSTVASLDERLAMAEERISELERRKK